MQDLSYSFVDGSSHNNGNAATITNNLVTNRSQTFSYDPLNRLKTAQTTSTHATDAANCWAETYNYDPWGNLLKLGADTTNQSAYTGCTQESGFDFTNLMGTNNRIATSGYVYDSAGNLTTSPGAGTVTFNAENQMITAGGVTYTYDGDGKRVKKSSGTLYWYGTGSDALLETDNTGAAISDYVFFNGKRVARFNGTGVQWYMTDHLGSSRVVWSTAGMDVSDFYPFGGERVISSATSNRYKFTSKERDSESGLDEFGARYYSSTLGRFTIPDWAANAVDVPYADFGNPQSLNLYSYVKNNPTNFDDPDGHEGPGDALGLVEILNRFADNPVGFAKSFLMGTLKQETANVRQNVGVSPSPVLEPSNDVERAGAATLNATADTATAVAPLITGESEEPVGRGSNVEPSMGSVRGAQRESMRQENIPTSQQPTSQTSPDSGAGRQYTYEVPKKGGGTETKIVTRQHMDDNHGTHVEAGKPKPNGQTDPSGRLRHSNSKTKVNVDKDQ